MSENLKQGKPGQPIVHKDPIEANRKGIRLVVDGKGINRTVEGIDDLKTVIPIVYHPELDESDICLIQGGVQVGAVENGLCISFDTLSGYYLRNGDRAYTPGQREGKTVNESGRYERDVFSFGRHAYETSLAMIQRYTDQHQFPVVKDPGETEEVLTIIISEIQALEDRIMISLTDTYSRSFRLRDDRGYFRWIGLAQETDGKSKFPSTVMRIPNIIEGSKQVFLRSNSVPYMAGTSAPILPMAENLFHGYLCGAMHALERQPQYVPACAIRSALFHQTFQGSYGINKLLSAAARFGIYPRLASKDAAGQYLWQKLSALAMAVKFYQTYYNATLPNNVGEVRYIFSGSGLTKVLEQMINMYIESAMLAVQTTPSNTKQGLFFMPATNETETNFHFGFVTNPKNENEYMTLNISDLRSKLFWHYDSVPAIVNNDGFIEITEEQQTSDSWRPLLIKPVHTIREKVVHMGAGFEQHTLEISDRVNNEVWEPSEMVESMIVGWTPAFAPKSVVMRRANTPSSFRDFKGFTLLIADGSGKRQGVKYTSPFLGPEPKKLEE